MRRVLILLAALVALILAVAVPAAANVHDDGLATVTVW